MRDVPRLALVLAQLVAARASGPWGINASLDGQLGSLLGGGCGRECVST